MKRIQNDQFLRGLRRNDRVTTIYDSTSDVYDKNACSSWLMYYLNSKNEYEIVTPTVKLGYPKIWIILLLRQCGRNVIFLKRLKELYWDIYQISLVPGY